jgi:hypothetical protein
MRGGVLKLTLPKSYRRDRVPHCYAHVLGWPLTRLCSDGPKECLTCRGCEIETERIFAKLPAEHGHISRLARTREEFCKLTMNPSELIVAYLPGGQYNAMPRHKTSFC